MSGPESARLAGMRNRVVSHLGSRDVSHIIYGATVSLALIIAVQDHPPAAGTLAAELIATGVAIGLAELYADFVSTEARTRRRVARADLAEMVREASAVVFGAGFPAIFFVLAAAGVLSIDHAFTFAKWSGIGLIAGYGYLAARLAGAPHTHSAARGLAIGLVGAALIALKALLH